eukprot:TRINITY_DN11385_c0_g1_i1.p1 TRINITY_DN11385_c0_g1~~TRINITY_DN11385_c0_g1_i1.p1  ORF type:complete len:471 (+),score=72.93 TRINITY_DN11385_c0_g1_i1:67-1479(+)
MVCASGAANGRPLLQIAPMMDVTYRDFRYFMRLLTRRTQLWTEMVVDDTILNNLEPEKCDKFLGYDASEHPIVCQLGGSDPDKLTEVAKVVERYGYDEVNLNVGCPSSRVATKGEFGCSLMKKKERVRDVIHAMSRAVQIPVTVKCRLGVDEFDSPEFTKEFVRTVAQGGCKHFQIHARKAWLKGLSPAQNRSIPPLHYPRVLELCREFPDLQFSLNGGVNDIGHARALLGFPGGPLQGESADLINDAWGLTAAGLDGLDAIPSNFQGVMIGRGAMNTPAMLWDVDCTIYGEPRDPDRKVVTRRSLLEAYQEYLRDQYAEGEDRAVGVVHMATKPTLGLFAGLRGNKAYRVSMDVLMRDKAKRQLGPAHVLAEAMQKLEEANPGLLDEPLAPTVAYKPGKGNNFNQGAQVPGGAEPRGKKRKGEPLDREDAAAEEPPSAAAPATEPGAIAQAAPATEPSAVSASPSASSA